MAIGQTRTIGARPKEMPTTANTQSHDGQTSKGENTMHAQSRTVNLSPTNQTFRADALPYAEAMQAEPREDKPYEPDPAPTASQLEQITGRKGKTREEATAGDNVTPTDTPPPATDTPAPDVPAWQLEAMQAQADVDAERQTRQQAPTPHGPQDTQQGNEAQPNNNQQGRLQSFSTDDIKNAPLPNYIIQGIIAEQTLTIIYGDSGTGKTFFTLDMVARIKEAIKWQDCPIVFSPSDILYFCLEGTANLGKRLKAWECYNGKLYPDIKWYKSFVFSQDIKELKTLCPENALIVIDTLGAASTGYNINDAQDMLKVINGLYEIIKEKKATVFLIHHTGKDATREAAGSFVLKANVDNQIKIEKMNASKAKLIHCIKLKDGEDGLKYQFTLHSDIDLGVDENGYSITSCAVCHDGRYGAGQDKEQTYKNTRPPKEGTVKDMALKALNTALQEEKTDALPIDILLQKYLQILPENAVKKCSKKSHYDALFKALNSLPNVVKKAVNRKIFYSINNDLF